MKKTPLWLFGAILCVSGIRSANAAITVVDAAGADLIKTSTCPRADGSNELNPEPVTYLAPPAAGSVIMVELAGGDTAFAGWTFVTGAALSGTATLKTYKSKFLGDHYSGGEIDIHYVKGAGDPSTLRWVQLVTTSDPIDPPGAVGPPTSPYIDPYPDDTPDGNVRPFYWNKNEIAGYTGNGNPFHLRFYDFSKRSHPPTSNVDWTGDLYLTSWDGLTPGTVTIHDGVRWGWKAGCAEASDKIPTVSEWGLIVMTLLVLTVGKVMVGRLRPQTAA